MSTPIKSDAFRGLCDHAFWHNAEPWENPGFRNGQIVFCKIDEVWRLFRALRRTCKRIVLVTAEGDKPVTPELWAAKPPHVMGWFGMNMFVDRPRAHPIPLGLGNADGTITLQWDEILQANSQPKKRDKLLYANFGTTSNPGLREPLLRWLQRPEQSWITREQHSASQGKARYLKELLTHRFVLCPPGNGEDTHRMWEALYCGAIPVVRKSPAMRAFQNLPIVFVEDLTAITTEMLDERSKNVTSHSLEILDLHYWKQRFDRERKDAKVRGAVSIPEWIQAWLSEICRAVRKKS